MAASEELFGEGYPGSFTEQSAPELRPAQLSDEMFAHENENGAYFIVPITPERTSPHSSNLTPEEERAMAQDALNRTIKSRARLAENFRKAGLEGMAGDIDVRTSGIVDEEKARLEAAQRAIEESAA